MVLIFAIPSGLTYTLGRMTGSQRHGWAVWAAMAFLFLAGVTTAYWAEARGNPLLAGTDQRASELQSGGNMEGKEVRFGIANSTLFATVTTDASCGAVSGMHDSYTPLGGMVPLINIMLGEVVFGGVGAGLYGVFVFVVLAVFIAGLMVGRTPEYLGKKIESYDVKMAMLAGLILTFSRFSGFPLFRWSSRTVPLALPTQGHTRCRKCFTHTFLRPVTTARHSAESTRTRCGTTRRLRLRNFSAVFMIIPVLAIAGSLAKKKVVPESAGTFPVTAGCSPVCWCPRF